MLKLKESGVQSYVDEWRKGYDVLPELRWTVPVPVFKKVLIGIHEVIPGLRTYTCLPADGVKGHVKKIVFKVPAE